jgi:hypothetical protein
MYVQKYILLLSTVQSQPTHIIYHMYIYIDIHFIYVIVKKGEFFLLKKYMQFDFHSFLS